MNVLDIALKTALDADSDADGIATLSNGGIFQINAPQGTAFNYTVFQELTNLPEYAFSQLAADHFFYQIKHLAVDDANNLAISGAVAAGTMADRTRSVLTDPTLNVSGKTTLYCRYFRSIPPFSERDDIGDRFIFHKGGVYEIWLA